jgi:Na+/proline symporter
MTFMKCQACVGELKTISRIWTRMSSRGVFIGSGIGLLVGIAITLAMWLQIGYFSPEKTNDIINDLIGHFSPARPFREHLV